MNEFKDIPGYEGRYGISRDGIVLSYLSNKEMKASINDNGYYRLELRAFDGTKKTEKLHRLIALTYIPNPENKPTVDHINRIRTDNRIENLRWASSEEQYYNGPNEWFDKNQTRLSLKGAKTIERPVEMRDKNNHNILYKTFSSSYQAAIQEFNDSSKNSLINRCANGNRPSAYGYWWCFKNK